MPFRVYSVFASVLAVTELTSPGDPIIITYRLPYGITDTSRRPCAAAIHEVLLYHPVPRIAVSSPAHFPRAPVDLASNPVGFPPERLCRVHARNSKRRLTAQNSTQQPNFSHSCDLAFRIAAMDPVSMPTAGYGAWALS